MILGLILWSLISPLAEEARTFTVDPVSLLRGETKEGDRSIATVHQGVTYLFADRANRDTFEKNPDRYAVQMGGACARMGPLSGKGNLALYTVFDEKLYVFGSEGCRDVFENDPYRTMDTDQIPPRLTGASVKEGRAMLAKLVAAMGGASAIDGIRTYTESYTEETRRRGETLNHHRLNRMDFASNTYTFEDDWGDRRFHRTLQDDKGRFAGFEGSWDMVPAQVRAMQREFLTQPLVVLRARNQDQLLAATSGEEQREGRTLVKVLVAYQGMNQTLLIDAETHELVAQRYRGRGQGSLFGPLEKRFSKYQQIGDLRLPTVIETSQEGKVLRKETWDISID